MLTIEEALARVLARATPLPPRPLELAQTLGTLLAETVAADLDLPPFDKALVDGYALRSSDFAEGLRAYRVIEEVLAGQTPKRALGRGETALVMTGAPLPEGADAVVMHEKTERQGETVVLHDPDLKPGRNRLTRGREMRAGDVVLQAGESLTPARLGLLASVGKSVVSVIPRPRVVVIPTGDELVEPSVRPGPGQIRNSNAAVLTALATTAGAEATASPIARDEPETLRQALSEGLSADILLITGGVSAGQRDLVPETLESLGVEREFHKIRLKPGKPLWFGVGPRRGEQPGTLVFGLPGNPVSGVVGFVLFVRPVIEILAGQTRRPRQTPARLAVPYRHTGDRPTFHPVRLEFDGEEDRLFRVRPLDWAGSAELRTVANADGFAHFPAGDRDYAAGEIVQFHRLG